jgi:SAM-dependent methyltransferase
MENKQILKEKWNDGKDFETDFWSDWIKTKGSEWPEDYNNRMNPELPLSGSISKFLKDVPGTPHILDVGAGPLSCLGKVLPDGRKVKITPIDPLAKEYTTLFREANSEPLISTLYGEVEKIDMLYPADTFDLVHMRNALDHSYDPLTGIKQMLRAVKRARVVILDHFTNEAEKANYGAFHQWNICEENGDFILWNKSNKINVTKELKGIADVFTDGNDHVTNVILKKL